MKDDGLIQAGLETIQGGRLVEEANKALKEVFTDIVRRPKLMKKRTVTIKLEINTDPDDETGLNTPGIDWDVGFSVPGHKGRTTKAYLEKDGTARVDKHGGDPRQRTIYEQIEKNAHPENLVELNEKEGTHA